VCWEPPPSVEEALRAGGARDWQVELTAQPLTQAVGVTRA
jgi:hypothetical protein